MLNLNDFKMSCRNDYMHILIICIPSIFNFFNLKQHIRITYDGNIFNSSNCFKIIPKMLCKELALLKILQLMIPLCKLDKQLNFDSNKSNVTVTQTYKCSVFIYKFKK